MIPARLTRYVEDGLKLLTSQYQTTVSYDAAGVARFQGNAPQLAALIASYLKQCQELENVLWDIWSLRQLTTMGTLNEGFPSPPTQNNTLMDTVGLLVGQPRQGMSDHDYLSAIYVRIAVNRMTGKVTEWSNIARILTSNGNAGGPVQYYEAIVPPSVEGTPDVDGVRASAGFVLAIWDFALNPVVVAQILAEGTPHGVLGELHWSTWPDGSDFEWTSSYDGSAGEEGWGSVYSTGLGLTSELGTPRSVAGSLLVLGVPPTYPGGGAVGGLWVAGSSLVIPTLQEAA
jgi:hypothetical protein